MVIMASKKSQNIPSAFSNSRGFTLLELLIVILIIGVLVAIGIRSFISSQIKSRDAKRKGDLESIARALEVYYNDNGTYPTSDNGVMVGEDSGGSDVDYSWGGAFYHPDNAANLYMAKLPDDPSAYGYYYVSDDAGVSDGAGSYYQLYALLENEQDSELESGGYSGTDCADGATSTPCNYGISSTNVTLDD